MRWHGYLLLLLLLLLFLHPTASTTAKGPPPQSFVRAADVAAAASVWTTQHRRNGLRAPPDAPYDPRDSAVSLARHRLSHARLQTWKEYSRTPLISLPHIARACGVASVHAKVEGDRCGLGSFKALGGSLAVEILAASLPEEEEGSERGAAVVSTASAGNHGIAVAFGAQRCGLKCVVYLHSGVGAAAASRMEALGAEVKRVPGDYAASVRCCAEDSAERGWHVIQDVDMEGYEDVPKQIFQGYTTVAEEIVQQLSQAAGARGEDEDYTAAAAAAAAPTTTTTTTTTTTNTTTTTTSGDRPPEVAMSHIFINAGVGGFAAATCGHLWERLGASRPRFVVVEPLAAPCVMHAAAAADPPTSAATSSGGGSSGGGGDGMGGVAAPTTTTTTTTTTTVMTGLDCKEVAPLAWRLLSRGADDFVAISDECVAPTMRLLASGAAAAAAAAAAEEGGKPGGAEEGDDGGAPPIVAGCSAVAGLGVLLAAARQPTLFAALGLDATSRVVVVICEGATEPELYEEIVGASPDEVVASGRTACQSALRLSGGGKRKRRRASSGVPIEGLIYKKRLSRVSFMKSPALRLLCISAVMHVAVSEALALAGKDLPMVIIGINAVVFALWQCIDAKFMETHFLDSSSVAHLAKRPQTAVLCGYSHSELDHFSANMCSLWTFSGPAMERLGARGFARLYSAGCILSTLLPAYLRYYRKFLFRSRNSRGEGGAQRDIVRGHGASGAISAVIAWVCLACPSIPMKFDLPVGPAGRSIEVGAPLALCGLLWLCRDIQGASGKSKDEKHIDYAAHVGGAAGGALVYCFSGSSAGAVAGLGISNLLGSAVVAPLVAAVRSAGVILRMALFAAIPDRMLQSELGRRGRRQAQQGRRTQRTGRR